MTFFGKELIHFLEAMGLQRDIVLSLYNFDFSETKSLAFIHSMLVQACCMIFLTVKCSSKLTSI